MTSPISKKPMAPVAPKSRPGAKKIDAKTAAASAAVVDEKRRRYVVVGLGLLLLCMLFGYWWTRPSAAMGHVRDMQKELFAVPRDKMPADERKQKFDDLRAEREKLSDDERNALRKEMGQEFQKKRSAEAIAYLKMSPAERQKVIDQKIAREQKATASPNGNAANRPGPTASAAPGGDSGTPNGPKSMTAEDRDNRRRDMLIHGSADARAGMDQMRIDMAVRRVQLGLPAQQPGRGR